jgi:carboxymethylenebutenolidase
MGHWTSLDTPTGPIAAWRAEPAVSPRGALVVVQEIFGVNAHVRSVVDRFAAQVRFYVVVPTATGDGPGVNGAVLEEQQTARSLRSDGGRGM